MLHKLRCKVFSKVSSLKQQVIVLKDDVRGAEFVQILIAVLIVIIVGGIVVGILRVVAPELINDAVDRIRAVFEL